jgi:hypothetical protein
MGLTAEDWVNIKWVIAICLTAILFFQGKLDGTILTGLILGVALPVTSIAQKIGMVEKP